MIHYSAFQKRDFPDLSKIRPHQENLLSIMVKLSVKKGPSLDNHYDLGRVKGVVRRKAYQFFPEKEGRYARLPYSGHAVHDSPDTALGKVQKRIRENEVPFLANICKLDGALQERSVPQNCNFTYLTPFFEKDSLSHVVDPVRFSGNLVQRLWNAHNNTNKYLFSLNSRELGCEKIQDILKILQPHYIDIGRNTVFFSIHHHDLYVRSFIFFFLILEKSMKSKKFKKNMIRFYQDWLTMNKPFCDAYIEQQTGRKKI